MTHTATTSTKNPTQERKADDFWLVHSSESSGASLSDALHALYYLPGNYRLLVLSDDVQGDTMRIMGHLKLKERIKLTANTEKQDMASPLLIADAVIAREGDSSIQKPCVVVAENTVSDIEDNEWSGFTVAAGNPPALATAVLKIARAAA